MLVKKALSQVCHLSLDMLKDFFHRAGVGSRDVHRILLCLYFVIL